MFSLESMDSPTMRYLLHMNEKSTRHIIRINFCGDGSNEHLLNFEAEQPGCGKIDKFMPT